MRSVRIGRVVLATVIGYAANGILVAATEEILPRLLTSKNYYIVDLISQCFYEVVAGYLCSLIARKGNRRAATVALVCVGLLIGTGSYILSWKAEPHWYGGALLAVWAPCVWVGYILQARPWCLKPLTSRVESH